MMAFPRGGFKPFWTSIATVAICGLFCSSGISEWNVAASPSPSPELAFSHYSHLARVTGTIGSVTERTNRPIEEPASFAANQVAKHSNSNSGGSLPAANVNPNEQYSQEPAPLGVADYGLNRTGAAESYGTDAFLGIATIKSLYDEDPEEAAECNLSFVSLSLQLNVVLTFEIGSARYYYWIQDIGLFEVESSTSSYVDYGDNIWNFSTSSSEMTSSSVAGNGSLKQTSGNVGYYSACASTSLSGVDAQVNFTASVKLLVNEVVSENEVEVLFSYYSTKSNNRVIFDSVLFPWAKNPSSLHFWVSGAEYNAGGKGSSGAFSDAEFVFGVNPGETTATQFSNPTSISMYLEYDANFSGAHQFEYVPNAYNFGSNTAETTTDANVATLESPVGAALTYAEPPGSLGGLYWSDEVRFITNNSGWSTNWTVELSGSNLANPITLSTLGTSVATTVPDGSYMWTITPPTDWSASPSSGTVTVEGLTTVFFSQTRSSGGDGCVAQGTPILTPSGYIEIQNLKVGATVEEYNFTVQGMTVGNLLWANSTNVSRLVNVNDGLLLLTPTDQPIYIRNSTFEGWLRDPQNLTIADELFNPITMSWVHVTSVKSVPGRFTVFDVITSGMDNFVANGALLDRKA